MTIDSFSSVLDQTLTSTSKRIEVLGLGVAFVKEVRDLSLSKDELKGLLSLIQKLLQKEGFLDNES